MTAARIGIIGTGWWATDTHIPALLAHPKAELVALCDSDEGRLHTAASRYEVDHAYTQVEQMLAESALDGVIIVSSNATHYGAAKAALNADVHVMLEKPMTLLAAEAKELVELGKQKGKELIIGYPFNYSPYAIRARDVIAAGELGDIQYIDLIYNSYMTPLFTGQQGRIYTVHGPDQYTKPALLGGGHGQVQVTHGAGLLFFVTGLRPQRVSALMHNHNLPMDLINVMTVQFEPGASGASALGTVSGNGNHQGLVFRLLIGCEKGWVDIDAGVGKCIIHRNNRENEEIYFDEKSEPRPLRYATGQNLVDVILCDAPNGSSAEVGWRAVELLNAAYRSAGKNGEFVHVDSLYA
jgi:predicted dehydrogenase